MNKSSSCPNQQISSTQCNGLAIASVPMQTWQSTYPADVALQKGTIFPELDLPFMDKGVISK